MPQNSTDEGLAAAVMQHITRRLSREDVQIAMSQMGESIDPGDVIRVHQLLREHSVGCIWTPAKPSPAGPFEIKIPDAPENVQRFIYGEDTP